MAYTYHGTSELIALPNRTVQTYPSGLVRVERSFVCRTGLATQKRRIFRLGEQMPNEVNSVAIDGLFIFPDPSEVMRDDGFVEFRVTAYGRTNLSGQRISLAPIKTFAEFIAAYSKPNLNYNPNNPASPVNDRAELRKTIDIIRVDAYYNFCVLQNAFVPDPEDLQIIGGVFYNGANLAVQKFTPSSIFPELGRGAVTTGRGDSSVANREFGFPFSVFPSSFQRVNFGVFDEIRVTYSFQPGNLDFGSFFNETSVPLIQIVDNIQSTYTGASIGISRMAFSDGVAVTIGGETLRLPYGGSARGASFSASLSSGALVIGGLSAGTVYQGSIAAFNRNGDSATQSISFRTRAFSTSDNSIPS
jgi:hypothetical protein